MKCKVRQVASPIPLVLLLLVACADDGTKPPAEPVSVQMTTTMGEVLLELDPEKAPGTVGNFLEYVDEGFYAGTIFHRVMTNFVIQGGGFTEEMTGRTPTHPPIPLESANGLKNVRGTIAMARTSDPNSATTQFFINLKDNTALDYRADLPSANGYAVFGRVIQGMDVVDSIADVETHTDGAHQNVPVVPIVIVRITR